MSRRLYCIIYKPTGEVCEVENGVCYDVHRSAYESKAFRRTLRVLRRGVPLHTHGKTFPARSATFRLETNGPKYRGIVSVDGYGIIELWEHTALDVLRRIACGYYPSLCKHFGPARQFSRV